METQGHIKPVSVTSLNEHLIASNGRITIGVLTYGLQHSICYNLWRGIHAVAREHEVNLFWFSGDQLRCPFGGFREQANIIYELANAETVDGLIIWGGALFPHFDMEEITAFFARYRPLPIICLSHRFPGAPSVLVDNYQGMRDAILHLIEVHKYHRIAFMRGPVKEGGEADERYHAYRDILKEYDLPYNPELVLFGNNEGPPAAAAMRRLLDEHHLYPPKDFEAVVASNDVMALAILDVFQAYGIRVPQDVALVGFDDLEPARAATPSLTTVQYCFEKLGQEATRLLLDRLTGAVIPEHIVLPLGVAIRQSCGCADASVIQAEIPSEKIVKTSSSGAMMFQQSQIMAAMTQTIAFTGMPAGLLVQVVTAFLEELRGTSPGQFFDTLQDGLRQLVAAEQDVEVWQDVVSALRHQLEGHLTEEIMHKRMENLCHQARVVIGQMARRVQESKRLYMAEQEQILRDIGARLITTFEVDSLMDILAEELPDLGIPACCLAVYEDPQPYAYPQQAPEWSHVILAYHEQRRLETERNGWRFRTHQLVPTEILPRGRRYECVVMPLYFRERQIGVVLFEATPREGTVYHALRTEISSALQGAFLVHQVQENAIEIIRQKSILDTFMATVPDAIYFKDRDSRITQSNKAHASLLGCADPGDTIGKTDFDFFPEAQARVKYDQEQEILQTGKPLLELEEPGAQGHWLLTTKMPLQDEQGNVVGTFGISRDITTLKHTEQELRRYRDHLEELVKERTAELTQTVTEAKQLNIRLQEEILERRRAEEACRVGEQQYRMLAEHVKDGIIIVQHGRLVFVNTAFAEMVEYPVEHLLQFDPIRLFPDHVRQQVTAHLSREDSAGTYPAWQVELITSDGRTVWTEMEESPIIWDTEFALLLTVRNIHQIKLREMRLEDERTRLRQENLTFRSAGTERYRFGPLVGKSPAMQRVYELIVSAATSGVNAFVVGESGTRKELIARTIHQVSMRKNHPFVPVNCASIPETLFEREFFGHRKGAFTGADRDKPGLFDRAHQGVLFLDEVTELSPGMQAKLLRVLQDGEYLPLGSNTLKQADVLIVAATNKDCRKAIEQEQLRQDFFYRIGVIELTP